MTGAMILLLLLQAAKPAAAANPPDMSTKAGVEAEAKVFFRRLDTNKDGKVERPEAQAFHSKAMALSQRLHREATITFTRLDTNKDGMLSREEYLAITGSMPSTREIWFDGNDANKDGRVELSEAVRRVQITFDALDTNKDGKLSAQEKAAVRGESTGRP